MKKVYDRSFRILAALFLFVTVAAIGFQTYLYFKNYQIYNFQDVKDSILNDSKIVTKKIKKIGAKKFDLFKVSERFNTFQELDEKIEYFSKKLNYKNDFEGSKNLKKLSNEISKINLSNKNIWKNYTESFLAYNKYIKKNKWRTLTRISNRINIRSPRQFSFEKDINYLLGINLKDLSLAQDVTKKSSLGITQKKLILDKTDNLIILTNLLIEENTKASKVRNAYLLTLRNLEAWSNFWSKKGQQYLGAPSYVGKVSAQFFGLSIIILILALGLCLFIMRKIFIGFNEKSQREIIFSLDKIIVKDDLSFITSKEEEFKNAVQTLNNYVKRRMSLGRIFQETIPFPCILLDENLNFKWFNQNFVEQLNFTAESFASESMNWDKIKENFLLEGHDPVIEAIEGNVAGIFQVKSSQEKSFQMYINPVNYNNKKYVMIMLYPLLTVEETINIQVNSTIEPIKKAVEALAEGSFNSEITQSLKAEFALANRMDLWTNFESLSHDLKMQKKSFDKEMQNFEKVTIEALNNSEYTTEVLNSCKNEVDQLQNSFGALKSIIVNFSSGLQETIHLSQNIFSKIHLYTSNYSDSIKKDIDLDKTIKKLINWGIPSISGFKTEIKSYRDQLKLIGRAGTTEAQKYLDKQEKLLRDTDLFFTKFEMFLEDLNKLSKEESNSDYEQIEALKGIVEGANEEIKERVESQEKSEEKLVELMRGFYLNVVKIQKAYTALGQEQNNEIEIQH